MQENRMSDAYRPATPSDYRTRRAQDRPAAATDYQPPRAQDRIAAARAKRQRRGQIASIVTMSLILLLGILLGSLISRGKGGSAETENEAIGEIPVYNTNSLPAAVNINYYNVPLSHSLQEYIYEICMDEQVPMSLVIGMIHQESNFTPDIASDTGDMGLMQINTINYGYLEEQYHCADMLNPYQNVFCGIKIVGAYLHKYNSYQKALMAYNMGEYGAQKAWEEGYPTSSYGDSIIALAEQYEDEIGLSANGIGLGLYGP